MSEREDDFLGRWARRKAEARGGLQKKQPERAEPVHKPGRMRTDPLPPKAAVETESDAVTEDGETETAALREGTPGEEAASGMEAQPETEQRHEAETGAEPENFDDFDFDSLDYESDYTRFMKEDVPEAVRKRALRMLWGSNPILANVDGLNDYDDDFTDAAMAVKGLLKTSYKPVTGYLTDEEREASYSEDALEHTARQKAEGADGEPEDTEAEETEVAEAGAADDEPVESTGEAESDPTAEENEKS